MPPGLSILLMTKSRGNDSFGVGWVGANCRMQRARAHQSQEALLLHALKNRLSQVGREGALRKGYVN